MKLICDTEFTTEIADILVLKVETCKIDGIYSRITKGIHIQILDILKKKTVKKMYPNNMV